MQNNVNTNVERIIAKIDNDFSPDNSDWIPRVGAWCIDAMNILKVFPTKKKKVKLIVNDKIVYSPCPINNIDITIYDKNGCIIKEAKANDSIRCYPSTGKESQSIPITSNTINISNNDNANYAPNYMIAETVNDHSLSNRYNVHGYNINDTKVDNNYIIIDSNKIELNYNTDYIYMEYDSIITNYSSVYNCDLPVIPNNGLLLEAIAYFCMYKMLCRGYKHPIFNLAASQYGTNPYYEWNKLKDEAQRSVIIDAQGDVIEDNLFRSNFFIETFNPRG